MLDDGRGGKIMTWASTRTFTSPGYATTNTTANLYGNFGTAHPKNVASDRCTLAPAPAGASEEALDTDDRKGWRQSETHNRFIASIIAAVLMLDGCTTSKLQYSRKADMSTYQEDKDYCLRTAFWGWGWSPGQNYRFCMERRGYVVTTTKPAPVPIPIDE